ncbi:hypothetical protein [Streptomyces celluloflavus]|uniref:hypothetical protein n=1 Tax=Streptomyces celluloflavus TaxID=58344 RepID=UPI0036631ABE
MSLLERGPDTVVFYPAGPTNADGTRGPAGAAVAVRCRVQPAVSHNPSRDGYTDVATYRVLGRTLPAGPWDRAEWAGRDWTVDAPPQRWRGSARTSHDVLVLRRR